MSGPFGSNQFFGVAAGGAAGYVPTGAVWLDGSADYFTRTQKAGNRKTYTLSMWVKHSKLGSSQDLFAAGTSEVDWTQIDSNNCINIGGIDGGAQSLISTSV